MERRSETLTEFAPALALAQSEMESVAKDSQNPHFQSNYAGLASVLKAVRHTLTKNGFSIIQIPSCDGQRVTISTILLHKSGEFVAADLTMTAREASPQAVGSVISYGRRYSLMSLVGVAAADDDDDGERGEARARAKAGQTAAQKEVLDRKLREMGEKGGMKKAIPPPIPEPLPDHGLGVGPHDLSLEDRLAASVKQVEARKKNDSKFREMVDSFAYLKAESEKLGKVREVYYGTLGFHGLEHCNEIRDMETGRKIYKDMAARLSEAKGMVDAEEMEAAAMKEG